MDANSRICVYRRKLIFLIETVGKDVLTFILKCGTKNPPTTLPGVCLDQYLAQLPQDSTANYVTITGKNKKKPFDTTQLKQIQKYPLWDNFDVTLLFKAIKLACEGVAKENDHKWQDQNELEGLIKNIKDTRNELFHEVVNRTEKEFQSKVDELKALFVNVLDAAKAKYCVSNTDFTPVKDRALLNIGDIRQKKMEKEMLTLYFNTAVHEFVQESENHLKTHYEIAQYFDPLSFLNSHSPTELHVQAIFCKIFLVDQSRHGRENRALDSCDILTLTQSVGQNPQPSTSSQTTQATQCRRPHLIMIRGVAGSGKTTLVRFILSEWLNSTNCTIIHLHEYDIVLRILCRENDGPSLQDFLKQSLPNYFIFIADNLVALLKKCKVLFLIDGLDELSQGSPPDQLVANIINTAKDMPDWTIVCTSRPETVHDFLNKVPEGYQKWQMEMKGISREQRTSFVLKQYDNLTASGKKDRDRLEYLMSTFSWKDHFGLPLNLLFVATLYKIQPDSLRVNTTQTSLYFTIHQWCIEKLQSRLSNCHDVDRDRQARDDSINMVLEDLYDVALKGLLKDKVSVSLDNIRCLRESCNTKRLPSIQVLPAFLCMRSIQHTPTHKTEQYHYSHKSVQEFYAALGIVHNVAGSSRSGIIRSMLEGLSGRELSKFTNLLLHVAGLLSHPETPLCPSAIQEVVELLAETGMESCSHWLSMLEDTDVNSTALDCVVRHITSDQKEWVEITDSIITSAKALLPRIPPKVIRIVLHRRQSDVQELIFEHHQYQELRLYHQYQHPDQATVCDSLLRATPRSHLRVFLGHLSAEAIQLMVPEYKNLWQLCLAVCDQDAEEVVSTISATLQSLPRLRCLMLHVPVRAVRTDTFTTRLPRFLMVYLVLSGVDQTLLVKASQIAEAMQPTGRGYNRISFPGSSMKAGVCRRLIDELAKAGVKVDDDAAGVVSGVVVAGVVVAGVGVVVPDTSPVTDEEKKELSSLANTSGLCDFSRWPEQVLWGPVFL